MKKRLAVILAIFLAAAFFAFRHTGAESGNFHSSPNQTSNFFSELKPQSIRAAASAVSPEVRNFARFSTQTGNQNKTNREVRFVSENLISRPREAAAVPDPETNLAQISAAPMPPPALSFDGISNFNNGQIYNLYFMPSDTNGDVGLNHYVQTVNALMRIYDKNGTALTSPFRMSNIFATLNTPCSLRDDGEPVVLYDPLADRWLLSQYCNAFPPFRQMIAVSQTGDPTGAYYLYEFVMPNNKLNDYAKFGVWPDGYYMSTDEFIGSDYAGTGVFAFDRQKMLAGDPTAGYIYFSLPSVSVNRFGGLLPADLDGLNPPPAGAPNIFVGYTATEYGDPQDAIRLFDFHADFQNPGNSTFTERTESPIPVAPFDPTSPVGRDDISQPAPGDKLDSQSDRLMYRVAYRHFGTHESLVFNQTVRTTPVSEIYRAGVRVYELRRAGAGFGVHEQTTVGDTTSSRWMAGAAQDHQGNIAVEYSFVSDLKRPTVSYTGKLAIEPAGTFRPEETLIAGSGVQTAFGFRWGDYTGMTVDVTDDCTFWMTNQYYSAESQAESPFSWLTRIGKFRFAECSNAPRSTIRGLVTNAADNLPIPGAVVSANSVYSRATNAIGNYDNLLVVPNSYSLTASARGFRPQTVNVTVVDGQTLTQNFALQPTAVLENAGTQITAESCAVNNSVEPSETVTMNIALRNTGARGTTNLTATLLSTGGVLNPSPAQNYGILTTGGASVSRPFTFTASPNLSCGDIVTLTFALADGAENLGTVAINLKTGVPRVAFQENFDSLSAPNLPNGWTTAATGAQQNWTTSTAQRQTLPNSAFSPDPNQVGLNELVSPSFSINSPDAELTFRNWYELETTFLRNRLYDGSVLEIKIGAGAWQDIETAGGTFLAGGYDGVIDGCCQNPLAGRRGWSGRSGANQTSEFITSKAKLPASAAGQSVQLRWRVGTDIGTFRTGQYIDNLVVTDDYVCSCVNSPNRAPFDFDGDGKTDFSVFRPSDDPNQPDFLVRNSSNNSLSTAAWGSINDLAANSDYDGDGRTDLAVFRPSERTWFLLQSSNNSIITLNFGLSDDRLAPADYDGDGRADVAVFRPSGGVWYILQSSTAQIRIQNFGLAEDLPVPADYDGDGRADVAVFRPSSGEWWILQSSNNEARRVRFGTSGDKPVAGDFDGDARADFVVFRPADRNWYLLRSQQGLTIVNFGLAEDWPLQADFDGDGRKDIAVFRPSTGVWYFLRSSGGELGAIQFGQSGDTPLPGIFVR